jgi:hypothetical protein
MLTLLWLFVGFSAALWLNYFAHEVKNLPSVNFFVDYTSVAVLILFGPISYFFVFILVFLIKKDIAKTYKSFGKTYKSFGFRLAGLGRI